MRHKRTTPDAFHQRSPTTTSTTTNTRAGALMIPSSCLDGALHGWVEVNTHSTPVLPSGGGCGLSQNTPQFKPVICICTALEQSPNVNMVAERSASTRSISSSVCGSVNTFHIKLYLFPGRRQMMRLGRKVRHPSRAELTCSLKCNTGCLRIRRSRRLPEYSRCNSSTGG